MWLRSLQGERDARLAKKTAAATMVLRTMITHAQPLTVRHSLTHSLDSPRTPDRFLALTRLFRHWCVCGPPTEPSEAGPADVAVLTMVMMPWL